VSFSIAAHDLALRLDEPPIIVGRRPRLQALTPGAEELLTLPGDPPGRLAALSRERVEALAPEQAQDQLLLCAALQRTFRPPQTLDIIDLQGSYRVSGQNRVRTIANCSGLVVCASRRSPATLALPGHPGAVMCVLARLPQLSLNGALVVWPSAYVLDDRGSLRARRAVPPRK